MKYDCKRAPPRMDPKLRAQLYARAAGCCECCGRPVPPGEIDHYLGRARAEESMATCWVLRPECHRDKTDNRPNAATWHLKFLRHCGRYGFAAIAAIVQGRLEWAMAKGARA